MSQTVITCTKACKIQSGSQADINLDASSLGVDVVPASTKNSPEFVRSLLDFDISAIPAGSTIQDTSKLELYVLSIYTNGSGTAQTGYRITQAAWTETGVTWNKYDGTNAWTTAGGDYSTPSVSYTGPTTTGWFSISGSSFAAFLQDALDNRAGIVRLILRLDAEDGSVRGFAASNDEDATNPPKLTVDSTTGGAPAAFVQTFVA